MPPRFKMRLTRALRPYENRALPEAVSLIRSVFRDNPGPFTTQEIYDLALKHPVEPGTVKHQRR